MPHTPQEVAPLFLGLVVGVIDVTANHEGEVLRPRRVSDFFRMLMVKLEQILGNLQRRQKGGVGVATPRCPFDRLRAARAWHPDWRVGLLNGYHPGVHDAEVEMFPLPPEWAWRRPGFDQKVVALLKALAVIY